MVVCDGIPATSMISQPGVFLGNLGFIVQSLASMQGPFLNQRAGSPLVYGERHLGWVRLQGVASGSTGPCPAPVDSRLWRHAPLPVSWGQTARSTGGVSMSREPNSGEVGWGRSHKTLSVSPEQALAKHSSRQVRLLWRLGALQQLLRSSCQRLGHALQPSPWSPCAILTSPPGWVVGSHEPPSRQAASSFLAVSLSFSFLCVPQNPDLTGDSSVTQPYPTEQPARSKPT